MKLFIASSSREDIPKKYLDDCNMYLDKLFKEENDLVFGAYNKGIMGLSYNLSLANGRNVIGICPEAYKNDLKSLKCTQEILTSSISKRTDSLITTSDALIFLPGGIGTLCELFVAIESKRCHEFDKPIIIYNSCSFFDKLLDFLNTIYDEKFAEDETKACYHISNSADDTINYLKEYYDNSKKRVKNKNN